MTNIGVLASGEGSNLQAIIDAVHKGDISGNVNVVISDQKEANALNRAKQSSIDALYIDPRKHESKADYEMALATVLIDKQVDLVVLAGYMRLLSPAFVQRFHNRILNIHPALLPAFPGLNSIQQAVDYGVKVIGCTVHFVDEGVDSGPILMQESFPVLQGDDIKTLTERMHVIEHRLYPQAIELFCRGHIIIKGRRCYIHGEER